MASMMGLSRDWSLVSTAPVGLALEASKLRWGEQEETSKSAMVKGMGFQKHASAGKFWREAGQHRFPRELRIVTMDCTWRWQNKAQVISPRNCSG